MTREELIRNLKYTMEKHKNDTVNTFGTNISVMCKDILDYLEKEPSDVELTEPNTATSMPCDDAISREDAIHAFDYLMGLNRAQIQDILFKLPSVRPQEKIGHWILLDECANSGYYCSECQKKLVKEGWSKTVKKIKFCPNCGAKMESEEV